MTKHDAGSGRPSGAPDARAEGVRLGRPYLRAVRLLPDQDDAASAGLAAYVRRPDTPDVADLAAVGGRAVAAPGPGTRGVEPVQEAGPRRVVRPLSPRELERAAREEIARRSGSEIPPVPVPAVPAAPAAAPQPEPRSESVPVPVRAPDAGPSGPEIGPQEDQDSAMPPPYGLASLFERSGVRLTGSQPRVPPAPPGVSAPSALDAFWVPSAPSAPSTPGLAVPAPLPPVMSRRSARAAERGSEPVHSEPVGPEPVGPEPVGPLPALPEQDELSVERPPGVPSWMPPAPAVRGPGVAEPAPPRLRARSRSAGRRVVDPIPPSRGEDVELPPVTAATPPATDAPVANLEPPVANLEPPAANVPVPPAHRGPRPPIPPAPQVSSPLVPPGPRIFRTGPGVPVPPGIVQPSEADAAIDPEVAGPPLPRAPISPLTPAAPLGPAVPAVPAVPAIPAAPGVPTDPPVGAAPVGAPVATRPAVVVASVTALPASGPTGPAPEVRAPSGRRRATPARRTVPLVCRGLTVPSAGGTPLLDDVSFEVPAGGLVAVIGPSGPATSAVCPALLGELPGTTGSVLVGGVDLLTAGPAAGRLVGVVQPDDGLPGELSVRAVLELAADLRLATVSDRIARVGELLELVELGPLAELRIRELDRLGRRRVSIALELVGDPPLLILDNPAGDLDEGLDHALTRLLRRIAEAGRTVVTITRRTANLQFADLAVALDSAGRPAYVGAPTGLPGALGARSATQVMLALRSAQLPRQSAPSQPSTVAAPSGADGGEAPALPSRPGPVHAVAVLARQDALRRLARPAAVVRDLVVLPFATGLAAAAAADRGLAGMIGDPTRQAGPALAVLVACTMLVTSGWGFGAAVGDTGVVRHPARWGVPRAAVVAARVLVLAVLVTVHAVVAWTTFTLSQVGPTDPLAGWPVWPTTVCTLGLLGLACACAGLLVGAAVVRPQRAAAVLAGVNVALVLLSGLVVPLGTPRTVAADVLAAVSMLAPSRWGTAALAAHIGYPPAGIALPTDALWRHEARSVVVAWAVLAGLSLAYAAAAVVLSGRERRSPRSK